MSRPVHSRARQPATAPRRQPFTLTALPCAVALLVGVAGGVVGTIVSISARYDAKTTPAGAAIPTVAQMMGMSDAELAKVDPLVMNLVVAKGIPECADLDIPKYAATVDEWARAIKEKNTRDEREGNGAALLKENRKEWLAGGMALMLAGTYGIKYTTERLDMLKPEQTYAHGVIDSRMGTCASMPVLYTAIGWRLGWPIKEVVSQDHCWARWDDGIAPEKGGERFNLEATTVGIAGHEGQFCIDSDEDYAKELKTPRIAIRSGSDMTSLTRRQTLGVHLQARAAYWEAKKDWKSAERDLLLATGCFPENRNIRIFLFDAMSRNNTERMTRREIESLAALVDNAGLPPDPSRHPPNRGPGPDVDAINRENARRLSESLAPPQPR